MPLNRAGQSRRVKPVRADTDRTALAAGAERQILIKAVDEQTPFVYPAAHEHENASAGTAADDAFDSLHTAPFTHGYEPHSSMSWPHSSPSQPAVQSHVYPSPAVWHVAPFWHGLDSQLSWSVSHEWPWKLPVQVQANASGAMA